MMRWKVILEERETGRRVTHIVRADYSAQAAAEALRQSKAGTWFTVRTDRAGKR